MVVARLSSSIRRRNSYPFLVFAFVAALAGGSACSSSSKSSNPSERKEGSPRERAQYLIEAANGAMLENDPIGALQLLDRAESLDPKFGPVYHAKALAFSMRKDFPRALTEMKKSVDLDPENPFALNTYGKFLLDSGRLDEAEAPLKKAGDDALFRESYKANTNLGILYYRRNQVEGAESRFQKAVNDDPANSCIAYYYLGHIAVKRAQLAEAERLYERATQKQCAAFADAHLALGMMYERRGKADEARRKFLELKQNFPETKASESAMERLKRL